MTPNQSLILSMQFQTLLRTDLLQPIMELIPFDLIKNKVKSVGEPSSRERIYTKENTVMTMVLTALQDDKSLQHSVNIFQKVFENRGAELKAREVVELELESILASKEEPKAGRPRKFKSKLPKSKTQSVSLNTAAYSKARERVDLTLLEDIFKYTTDFTTMKKHLWHGMDVYLTDGTYFQMQDSVELRKKYFVKENDNAYPQGLLQGIIHQGNGYVYDYQIGTRHQSELEIVSKLIPKLPEKCLLIADDLYNTYAIFALIKKQGCHILVPGKRVKNYKTIKTISQGDEIVELKQTEKPKWWNNEEELPQTLLMRRISFLSPIDGKTIWVLYTSILDEKIDKGDIIAKYSTRWDIEISIREVKTLMGMSVARGKTESMVLKEFGIALIAYNLLRKIIAKSVHQTDFSPKESFFQECFENRQTIFIDKKGRIYNRWSTGRYGKNATAN